MAASRPISVKRSRLHTEASALQLTIYGARHTGTYRNGETTKLRITTSDPEANLLVIGLTGNNEETFEIRTTLGPAGFLGLSAIREGINLMIEELA